MNPLRACTIAIACLLPLLAQAQWQWVDNQGRRVFSDQAPPPDIPAKNILRQPGVRSAPAQDPATPAAPAAARPVANAPKLTGKDAQLEEKRKQAEAAEADKRKKAEEQQAAVRAENCKRARSAKATLDSGVRLSQTNDKGEREILDDKQRAEEAKRIDAVIARECAPAAQ